MKNSENNFTQGPILAPLLRFAFPVLLALILQAMYGAVDLIIVGQFGTPADVSAVSTGSQLMATITSMVASFSIGTTILLGQQIGQGLAKESGKTIGASIALFFTAGCLITALTVIFAQPLAQLMHAPIEAFAKTTNYIRICGAGLIIIIFYNLIGSVFRGIGDSRTPLFTVAVACVVNIIGDLILVAGCGMGTEGAALATVAAQAVSVVLSFLLVKKKQLSFSFSKKYIRFHGPIIRRIVLFGAPVALQDLLVGGSFLVIAAIVNSLGLIPSAGVGVAEKVCAFIMLVPSAFMQSLSAIVSQNYGARRIDRTFKTLRIAIVLSIVAGVTMAYITFFHGHLLAGIFANEAPVIAAGAEYLKAYAIDCLLTAFLFCFIGFYNGIGKTSFVMIQGICGAFLVRIPLSILFSGMKPVSLFRIGLATPCSTLIQIALCIAYMLYTKKRMPAPEE